MFARLKDKWNVNGWRLFLILITFALGGSLCGLLGRRLMGYSTIEHPVLWTIVYIILLTVIWPLSVLVISIPMGQYKFFKKYLRKMGHRMKIMKPGSTDNPNHSELPTIAILASGTGTNARRIIEFSQAETSSFKVGMVVCNKPGAGVIAIAESYQIPVLIIEKEQFFRGDAYVEKLKAAGIDFIVLAGFLWKIPAKLVEAYRNRIINIHPALLPQYGGKGMYGQFVHEAVIANKDTESGISIHWVDELYDHGSIIFQATCPVLPEDTPSTLASRIHELEHKHYPVVLNQLLEDMFHP
jgi:formyltetrahydrofolate-dependent phosphoribosylglycinamide formyltransferase